jgi:hypothetical protein
MNRGYGSLPITITVMYSIPGKQLMRGNLNNKKTYFQRHFVSDNPYFFVSYIQPSSLKQHSENRHIILPHSI